MLILYYRQLKLIAFFTRSVVDAVNRIKPAAEVVLNAFQEMNTPDEIALEFGLNFSAKAGAIFTSVDSAAAFKVSLKWTNEKK